jgi:serine/threonine protein kinase/Tfp pilus assembly protein PilF
VSATVSLASDDRRERAERLFEEARSLPPEDRARFITAACDDDATLAAELLSLLDHAEPGERLFTRLAEVVVRPVVPSTVNAGRFEILGLIGAGGMGTVYRAHDTRLNRAVALKVVPPHQRMTPGAEGRLLLEARAAAALDHVNICTVYEIGETDEGWPFIAMALYEGETLKDRLARGSLSPSEAVDIALQVARGLAAAHTHGVVHRDVKPGNIMLTAGGTAKLLDFGLATMSDTHLTPGITPGTVPYMSPEQTRGEAVGPQSDLWSLGVVMYEMLTGVRPFQGENNREVIQAIRRSTPEPPRRKVRGVPVSLERIVERLLQKQPDERYQDTDELVAALAEELSVHVTTAVPVRAVSSLRHRRLLLVVLLAVVTAASVGWWSARQASTESAASGTAVPVSSPPTLALLPFTSADAEDAYLSEGLVQELTRALSKLRGVRVVSRASALSFKGDQRDVQKVGRALNVSTVLVGSVQRSNARLRISARLVNVADGAELWSKTYEGSAAEMSALQRELALRIANALDTRLSPNERDRLSRPGTRSQEALALYLKGRYFWNQRTAASYRRAVAYFEQAIVADSQYAAPWAGLAAVYSQQGMAGQLTPQQARERSRAAALRAIALDDSLAEAHVVLGADLHAYDWDSERAEREFRRAVGLDPNYATARHYYGNFLRATGRLDEAIAQQTTAVELDPLVPAFNETLALTLLRAGRAEEAFARVRSALELDSTYWRAHAVLGGILEVMHRDTEAMHEYERANQLAGPAAHRTTGDMSRVLAHMGRKAEARRLLAVLQSRAAHTTIYEPAVATAFYALGDDAAAYDWLEHAYRHGDPGLRFMAGDARFLPMSADPRFVELLQRVRLPH